MAGFHSPELKKIGNVVFYILLALFALYFLKRKFYVPQIEKEKLQLQYFDGTPVNFEKLKGKVVVLNFWQTWCGPCVGEMPNLNNMPAKWADIEVLCITNETKSQVNPFIEKYPNIHFVYVKDLDAANITQFPTTYILNKQGAKVFSKIGSKEWDDDNFIATLKKNWN